MAADEWDEFYEIERAADLEKDAARKRAERYTAGQLKYEVGLLPPPPPEIMELREKYAKDFVAMHHEVFTESSGLKPLGPAQIDSAQRSNDVFMKKGRLVKCEPRSFGKTTRSSNEALYTALMGKRKFILIIASSVEKAKDIIDGIRSELTSNEKLAELFPNVCACFEHAQNLRASSVKYQTIGAELTHIKLADDRIIFPFIEGEPSSGTIIMVRSKDNVRGTIFKLKKGPMAGRVLRPDIVLLDDIQTDEEAENPERIRKLVKLIKKSILRSGRLGKRIDAIMTITPQNSGDLATHFMEKEPGWEVVRYKMLAKRPTAKAEELWFGTYRDLLLNFNKHIRGDKERARTEALEYYRENKEAMEEGHEVSWDWAYGWDEEPQTEISTIQACYNIMIEEGMDVFETECQTNVLDVNYTAGTMASIEDMRRKIHPHKKGIMSESCFHVVCHIDIGKYLMAYTVAASPKELEPMVIDYGLWPNQNINRYTKPNWPAHNIQTMYSEYSENVRVRMALIDLINFLVAKRYKKHLGIQMPINLIGVDCKWNQDQVQKVCREHIHSSILIPQMGAYIDAKAIPVNDRQQANAIDRHFYCSTLPSRDRGGHVLWVDVNYMKTQVHQGWMTPIHAPGSITMYEPSHPTEHEFFYENQLREFPTEDHDPKSLRTKTLWKPDGTDIENEFFDNLTGVLALFSKRGVLFPEQAGRTTTKEKEAADYFKSLEVRKF